MQKGNIIIGKKFKGAFVRFATQWVPVRMIDDFMAGTKL